MNIGDAILEEHSAARKNLVAGFIGNDPERFAELMRCVLQGETDLARKAAWIMSECCESHPELIGPYLEELIALFSGRDGIHQAIKRNMAKMLQSVDLPENLIGRIFNLCFDWLDDPDETAAVRVYSMSVLGRICRREPELKDEVLLVIRRHLPFGSAAYRSRAGRVIAELEQSP